MIRDLAILLSCQLAGEVIARGADLPVPGPVLGMVILVATLILVDRNAGRPGVAAASASLGATADRLLGALGLLFVPAGVGVIRHLDLLVAHGLALGVALVGSVLITLLVSVGVFRLTSRLTGRTDGADG